MKPELVDLMVKAMGWEAFENLVFALVRADEPTARQLRPPDGGRDTIVAPNEDHGELVWQAKRYTSRIYWDKCEKSLITALEKHSPERITFVFAVNLSEDDETKLNELRETYQGRVTLPDPWTLEWCGRCSRKRPPCVGSTLNDRGVSITISSGPHWNGWPG